MRIKCPRRGDFALADSIYVDLPELLQPGGSARRAMMSHTIRRMQRSGQQITIHPITVETYWRRGHLPTPKEQVDDLILWIGDNQPSNSMPVTEGELVLDAWIGAALPSTPGNASGLRWLLEDLELEAGTNPPRLFNRRYDRGTATLQLTLAGWERYDLLGSVLS
jgi:hypothetical protein